MRSQGIPLGTCSMGLGLWKGMPRLEPSRLWGFMIYTAFPKVFLVLLLGLAGCEVDADKRRGDLIWQFTNNVSLLSLNEWAESQIKLCSKGDSKVPRGYELVLRNQMPIFCDFFQDSNDRCCVLIIYEFGLVREGFAVGTTNLPPRVGQRFKLYLGNGVWYVYDTQ
jgi:hypothetical protein